MTDDSRKVWGSHPVPVEEGAEVRIGPLKLFLMAREGELYLDPTRPERPG